VDAHGQLIPLSEEEIRRRSGEIARRLDALDDIGDDQEQRQTLEALEKAMEDPASFRVRIR
jgi:hypothetical protein